MLAKQPVPIPFGQGVDTKTDAKQVKAGKLLALFNGIFTSTGKLRKRNGFGVLPASISGGGSISAGLGIASFNQELLLMDTSNLYSYASGSVLWTSKGKLSSISVASEPVYRSGFSQTSQDGAMVPGGIRVYAWEDSGNVGTLKYSVVDDTTGELIVNGATTGTTVAAPRVVIGGNPASPLTQTFYVFYLFTGPHALTFRTISQATPGTISSATNINGVSVSTPVMDVCTAPDGTIYFAFGTAANTITVGSISTVGVVTTRAGLINPASVISAISLYADASGNALVSWVTSGNVVQYASANVAGNSSGAIQTIETLAGVTSIAVAPSAVPLTASSIYYSVGTAGVGTSLTKLATVTGYTANVTAIYLRSVALATKPWVYGGNTYVGLAFNSPQQCTYFVADSTGNIVARALSTVGGGTPAKTTLPGVWQGGTSTQFWTTFLIKDLLTTQGGTIFTQTGVQAYELDFFSRTYSYQSQEIGNELQVSGAALALYDAGSVVEHGFHVSPEALVASAVPLDGALGASSSASYEYVECFEWVDNQGQTHRSSPSTPATLTVPGTITVNMITTSGAKTLSINVIGGQYLYSGMIVVSDSAGNIPAGTLLNDFLVLSANATGSGSTNVKLGYQLQVNGYVLTPSAGINIISSEMVYHFGTPISGNAVIPMVSARGLFVGQTISGPPGSGYTSTITAINGNNITVAAAPTFMVSPYTPGATIAFYFQYLLTYACSIGSPNLTVSTAAALYAANFVGAIVDGRGANIPVGATVVSASGTTIVISQNATTNAAAQVGFIYLDGTSNLVVGQTITGAGVPAGTVITAITSGFPGVVAVTPALQQFLLATSSATAYTVNNTYQASIIEPTLRLTAKPNVTCVLYRTTANGSTFYRQTPALQAPNNDKTVDSLTVTDVVADSIIVGDLQLYTTGGVLENTPCPPTQALTTYKSRLMAVNQEDGSIWYSKQVVPGSPVEFSTDLSLVVDPKGGVPTVIGNLDDKFVIFKSNTIFALTGDGPSPSGANNDFSNPQQVTSDCGCNNPNSVVVVPSGIMYQSAKGIYLLDRSLSVSYIGAPVETYNSQTVTSAVLCNTVNQVRFTLGNGTALVYDYAMEQWGVFTNVAAIESCLWNGVHTFVDSSGVAHPETVGTFTDNGAGISLSASTAWLTASVLQNFQRVYDFLVLGSYISPHTLTVQVAYNFLPAIVQTDVITVASAPTTPYQYRVFLALQKCQSLQITVFDTPTSPLGEGVDLSALTFQVGVKKGLNKLAPGQAVG